MPGDAELHLALGLNLVRQHRAADALAEIARAAEIDPGNAQYAYVYAVALNSAGRTDDAIKTFEASHARHPAERDTLFALVTIRADRLATIDPSAKSLVDQLRLSAPSR